MSGRAVEKGVEREENSSHLYVLGQLDCPAAERISSGTEVFCLEIYPMRHTSPSGLLLLRSNDEVYRRVGWYTWPKDEDKKVSKGKQIRWEAKTNQLNIKFV